MNVSCEVDSTVCPTLTLPRYQPVAADGRRLVAAKACSPVSKPYPLKSVHAAGYPVQSEVNSIILASQTAAAPPSGGTNTGAIVGGVVGGVVGAALIALLAAWAILHSRRKSKERARVRPIPARLLHQATAFLGLGLLDCIVTAQAGSVPKVWKRVSMTAPRISAACMWTLHSCLQGSARDRWLPDGVCALLIRRQCLLLA